MIDNVSKPSKNGSTQVVSFHALDNLTQQNSNHEIHMQLSFILHQNRINS